MNKFGRDINEHELDVIMEQHGLEKNKDISSAEFKAMLLGIEDI